MKRQSKSKKRKSEGYNYAKSFFEKVKSDFQNDNLIMPEIRFYKRKSRKRLNPIKGVIQSRINGIALVQLNEIRIYEYMKRGKKELEYLIRHEMIHILCYQSNLPYEDTDIAFEKMCGKYDAIGDSGIYYTLNTLKSKIGEENIEKFLEALPAILKGGSGQN